MTIEHKIILGLITSDDFLREIAPIWDPQLIEEPACKRLAIWAMEYYDQYNKAPGQDIWSIFYSKRSTLQDDLAEDISDEILPGLADVNEDEPINLTYLLDQTHKHFTKRNLKVFTEEINGYLLDDKLLDAENKASEYKPVAKEIGNEVDFKEEAALDKVEKAFSRTEDIVIKYPRQLGKYWNRELRKGGFVAFMATEKRGKTFFLMDMAMRGITNRKKIAFFQAGDMTEEDQIMRVCVHLTKRSNIEEYTGKMWEPCRDCIWNQLNTCEKPERQSEVGVLEEWTEKQIRTEITLDQLQDAWNMNKDMQLGYEPCHNCDDYWDKRGYGSVWINKINAGKPLTMVEAKKKFNKTMTGKANLKLSTHVNGTLSVKNIRSYLELWSKQDSFVPDAVIIDYADLLVTEFHTDFRHQQFEIWKDLRGLSQDKSLGEPLVITATQSDAKSYDQNILRMANFSEDKRKYGQVTAMYGLNQDKAGREKKIGMMRINELVKREGSFSENEVIVVLQNLKRGQPCLQSYFP